MPARTRTAKSRANESRRRYAQLQAFARAYKAKPCADCGVQYPYYVMQLDHLPGKVRRKMPSECLTPAAFALEAESCEIVCANCHAARTWQRKQWGKRGEPARRVDPTLPFDP